MRPRTKRKGGGPAAVRPRYLPGKWWLIPAALLLSGLALWGVIVDRPVPRSLTSLTPVPQPRRVGSEADIQLIEQAGGALPKLSRYHYEISAALTEISGDVVRSRGASMTGKYMGTPVGVLLRDDQFYEREGDGWVAKPVTDALKPLLGESITDANVKYTLEWMQNPVGTTYNRFYSFPLLRSQDYDITRGVFVLGEETLHNTQVTSYELPSCVNCFGDMPRYYMASAWIDPVTKHVHKYKVAPPGFHGATITISRHDDPSLELPTP